MSADQHSNAVADFDDMIHNYFGKPRNISTTAKQIQKEHKA